MMPATRARWLLLWIAVASIFPASGQGQDSSTSNPLPRGRGLDDGFSYRVQGLGYGFIRDAATNSALNPGNALGISRYEGTGDLRLDMALVRGNLTLGIKPRLNVSWQKWNSGSLDGESETNSDLFVNEWVARYGFGKQLFASYGRENLQWGPSYLLSPSNPFIEINGKSNPWLEMPGLDYARVNWIANPTWSVQLIANTNEGQWDPIEPFRKVYASKVDYVDVGRYGSLILSHREGGLSVLGGYGGLTISDTTLAHAEGSVSEDGNAKVLIGGSYTFGDGSTVVLEYYHNGDSCQKPVIRNCFPPYGDTIPGQYLYRGNYGFVQYLNNEFITRSFDLALRGTYNVDDGSSLVTAILNYALNDHAELFTVADWYAGGNNDEFGSATKWSVMAGVSLTY